MNEGVIATLIVFAALFGIVYVVAASRTRIRMALIEKGADVSIFNRQPRRGAGVMVIILVNLALLLFSVGIAIFIAAIMHQVLGVDGNVAYAGSIFVMAGIGLFVGYIITAKISKEECAALKAHGEIENKD